MNVFARAVITGFGFSLGKALYERVSKKLGFESDKDSKDDADAVPPPIEPLNADEGDGGAGAHRSRVH